jgi:hypothetical protein
MKIDLKLALDNPSLALDLASGRPLIYLKIGPKVTSDLAEEEALKFISNLAS